MQGSFRRRVEGVPGRREGVANGTQIARQQHHLRDTSLLRGFQRIGMGLVVDRRSGILGRAVFAI